MTLDYTHQHLTHLAQNTLSRQKQEFAALAAALDALSPLKVLGRGYAVAKNAQGTILKNAADVQKGEQISVALDCGALECTVDAVITEKEP